MRSACLVCSRRRAFPLFISQDFDDPAVQDVIYRHLGKASLLDRPLLQSCSGWLVGAVRSALALRLLRTRCEPWAGRAPAAHHAHSCSFAAFRPAVPAAQVKYLQHLELAPPVPEFKKEKMVYIRIANHYKCARPWHFLSSKHRQLQTGYAN